MSRFPISNAARFECTRFVGDYFFDFGIFRKIYVQFLLCLHVFVLSCLAFNYYPSMPEVRIYGLYWFVCIFHARMHVFTFIAVCICRWICSYLGSGVPKRFMFLIYYLFIFPARPDRFRSRVQTGGDTPSYLHDGVGAGTNKCNTSPKMVHRSRKGCVHPAPFKKHWDNPPVVSCRK